MTDSIVVDPAESSPFGAAGPIDNQPSRLVSWIALFAGCALVGAWVLWSPLLAEQIPVRTVALAASVFYLVLFAPLIAVGGFLGLITGVRTFGPGHRLAAWVPAGLAIGAGGLLFAVGLAWLNGGLVPEEQRPLAVGLLVLGMVLTLIQVTAEEVVFRGWLQALLSRLAGPWVGLLAASAIFASMHLIGGAMPPLALANVFLAGMVFGLLAKVTGGIATPTAAHFGWNTVEVDLLGLSPNPGVSPFGALHDVQIIGPQIWGGGEDGLNASIGTTIALVALILPLLAVLRRRALASGI